MTHLRDLSPSLAAPAWAQFGSRAGLLVLVATLLPQLRAIAERVIDGRIATRLVNAGLNDGRPVEVTTPSGYRAHLGSQAPRSPSSDSS